MEARKTELVALERGFWDASRDLAFYEEHLDPEGVAVFPMDEGILDSRAILASVGSGQSWSDVEFTNLRLIDIDRESAALVYEALGQRQGEADYRAFVTSVYRRQNGDWKLVLHQQTPVHS